MKSIWDIVSILIAIVLCSCGIKRQKETYVTYVEHKSYVRGGDDYWNFYDKGEKYEVLTFRPPSEVVGEKYIIIYDSLNPAVKNKIDFSRPVFIEGERTNKTTCIVIKHKACYSIKKEKNILVEFEYYVNGRRYESICAAPLKKDTICYNVGDKFDGEYWMENPKRVIIYLDKPVK